jgi:hypothetical protein
LFDLKDVWHSNGRLGFSQGIKGVAQGAGHRAQRENKILDLSNLRDKISTISKRNE